MASVNEHYKTHLAPIYLWMVGGFTAAIERGEAEIAEMLSDLPFGSAVIDLGAGFGMHSIPLARRGCSVVAIDTSSILLDQLRDHSANLPIHAIDDDLLSFLAHVTAPPQVILCLGDTLTHLPSQQDIEMLFERVASTLMTGGRFIVSFRDYSSPLTGTSRFIHVKSDSSRILTCFLEYGTETVMVHDIVHERTDSSWQMHVSAYPKLRVAPDWVTDRLRRHGFTIRAEPAPGGMVRIVATRYGASR